MINASYKEIFVKFERKKNLTLVFLLSNYLQVFIIFHDRPVNFLFDDFDKRLQGYMIIYLFDKRYL